MKRLLFIILTTIALPATATHIVGGEFELVHKPNPGTKELYHYNLNLIYYFDENHGEQAIKKIDSIIFVKLFRFSDNAVIIDTIRLRLTSQEVVAYSDPACTYGGLKASRQFYTAEIILDESFNDPQGYYVVWERCCRNYSINNIYSNDPQVGLAAGQTFYLKFPPVVKNGNPFVNSSPSSFPPLRDYACPFRKYYANFAGTDPDGDSVAYSLTTPYTTNTADSYPLILPEPYPEVTWVPGYGLNAITKGHPDFSITPDGYVTVTPGRKSGLYVFAVLVEEFRNGVKIGETRRDFQLYVSDSCPFAQPPQLTARKKGETNFSAVHENVIVEFQNTVSDQDRCIEIQLYDPDVDNEADSFKEEIKSIKIISQNFSENINNLLPFTTASLTKKDSTKIFSICFPDCPYIEGPIKIAIVAIDDACPQGTTDTLFVTVNVVPPINHPPVFSTPDVVETLGVDQDKTWPILATDQDGDLLIESVVTDGFNLADVGLSINPKPYAKGSFAAELEWNTDCIKYNFSNRTELKVSIFLEDKDHCDFDHPVVMTFNLKLDDGNVSPVIYQPTSDRVMPITFKIHESVNPITFDVKAHDDDNDKIVLSLRGNDFNVNDYGAVFPGDTNVGEVSSPFTWNIDCKKLNLSEKSDFDFQFIAVDNQNRCHIYKADTLDVIVTVLPPDNSAPLLEIYKNNVLVTDTLSYRVGSVINLDLMGTDTDQNPADFLTTELKNATGKVTPTGYVFIPHNGISPTHATFTWQPDCTIFENNSYSTNFSFKFKLTDDRCFTQLADSVTVFLKIGDAISDDKKFNPINVITPNGDGCNDYFAFEGIEETNTACGVPGSVTPDEYISLPGDNCIRHFERIKIFNRWGKEVFSSPQRNFRWYAKDVTAGVYFYTLQYSDKVFKGTVSVLF